MNKQAVTPKFVSVKFARKWYDIGRQYKGQGSLRYCIEKAIFEDGHQIDCWEKVAAFKAGWSPNNFEFLIKKWKRYGDIPVGSDGYAERSFNHAQGEPEYGVSVADEEWENSIRGQISEARQTRKVVYFIGLQVGYGSDGEPVVLPVREED